MQTCQVDGQEVSIGDSVCFKSDVEQSGKVIQIYRNNNNRQICLVLESNRLEGFQGDYIGGDDVTEEYASDCWID